MSSALLKNGTFNIAKDLGRLCRNSFKHPTIEFNSFKTHIYLILFHNLTNCTQHFSQSQTLSILHLAPEISNHFIKTTQTRRKKRSKKWRKKIPAAFDLKWKAICFRSVWDVAIGFSCLLVGVQQCCVLSVLYGQWSQCRFVVEFFKLDLKFLRALVKLN